VLEAPARVPRATRDAARGHDLSSGGDARGRARLCVRANLGGVGGRIGAPHEVDGGVRGVV